MRKNGLFDTDFRFDLSLAYKVSEPLTITLFGQNLLRLTKQWRYMYIMMGASAVDEPTVVGIRTDYRF